MKLKPKEKELKPKHMRLTVPGQTHEDLLAYVEYYAKTYRDAIEPTDLMIEMAAQFMSADTGFRRWRTGQEEPQTDKPNGGSRLSYSQPAAERTSDASSGH